MLDYRGKPLDFST